jgi:hypothetical protein
MVASETTLPRTTFSRTTLARNTQVRVKAKHTYRAHPLSEGESERHMQGGNVSARKCHARKCR